jgi:lipopolysaccharide/colanic/teichoic acid biosynthesis glycosyltransferase
MIKRSFDFLTALIGLIVLFPLFFIISLLIKLTSPGPVFHRGKRVGLSARLFNLYKFRTMIIGAENTGPGITSQNDPRITSVGRILRRAKLDELPQLINVLKGEMSLVGPRPEDPRYVLLYNEEQRRILSVRPGITSPASIRFRHEENMLSVANKDTYVLNLMPEKIIIDLRYLERQTLWTDLSLLFCTVFQVFKCKKKLQ